LPFRDQNVEPAALSPLPSAQAVGTAARQKPTLARQFGELVARAVRAFGFNTTLAPVVDLALPESAEVMGTRCVAPDPAHVVEFARAFMTGLAAQRVVACGKHFPGYSAATIDAHHDLPLIERSRSELEENELAVFRQFAARVDSMMICHGWYRCLEPQKTAASLSRLIVTDLLRHELGFSGLVMTDDLDMGAILNEYGFEETIRRAISAGNDLAMICHRVKAIEEALGYIEKLPVEQLDRALENIARFKATLEPPRIFLESEFATLNAEIWQLRVAVLGEEHAAQLSPEDGKRSPVETY